MTFAEIADAALKLISAVVITGVGIYMEAPLQQALGSIPFGSLITAVLVWGRAKMISDMNEPEIVSLNADLEDEVSKLEKGIINSSIFSYSDWKDFCSDIEYICAELHDAQNILKPSSIEKFSVRCIRCLTNAVDKCVKYFNEKEYYDVICDLKSHDHHVANMIQAVRITNTAFDNHIMQIENMAKRYADAIEEKKKDTLHKKEMSFVKQYKIRGSTGKRTIRKLQLQGWKSLF